MKTFLALSLTAAAALSATPIMAHHSFAMFDPSREEVVEGIIVRWNYSNPHTFMIIEDPEGTVWAFEGAAPAALASQNPPITGNTFQVGDPIVVIHCPLRDGRPGGAAGIFIMEDGSTYSTSDAGCRARARMADWPGWYEQGYRSLEEVEAAQAGEGGDETEG